MYKFFFSCLVLFITLILEPGTGHSQWRIPADSIFQFIKSNSIYRHRVGWETLETNYRTCLMNSKGNEDIVRCFVQIFEAMDDVHSAIFYKNKYYSYYHTYSQDSLKWMTPLIARSNSEQGKIKTNLVKGKYAYIQLPGINAWGDQINLSAQALSDSISKYARPGIKGVIVDLRLNSGGQLASMLAGLHSLLGNGPIGGEIDADGKLVRDWKIENGNFYQAGVQITNIPPAENLLAGIPVVVLIGAVTRSSGSLTAIAFKGRPNTYFVGEPTANGYSTSNGWHQVSAEFTLNLSEAFIKDRKGRIYTTIVPPDLQVVGDDDFEDLSKDFKVRGAIWWFEKNGYK